MCHLEGNHARMCDRARRSRTCCSTTSLPRTCGCWRPSSDRGDPAETDPHWSGQAIFAVTRRRRCASRSPTSAASPPATGYGSCPCASMTHPWYTCSARATTDEPCPRQPVLSATSLGNILRDNMFPTWWDIFIVEVAVQVGDSWISRGQVMRESRPDPEHQRSCRCAGSADLQPVRHADFTLATGKSVHHPHPTVLHRRQISPGPDPCPGSVATTPSWIRQLPDVTTRIVGSDSTHCRTGFTAYPKHRTTEARELQRISRHRSHGRGSTGARPRGEQHEAEERERAGPVGRHSAPPHR